MAESLERQLENVDPEDIDKVVTTIIGYWNQLKDNNGKIPETTNLPETIIKYIKRPLVFYFLIKFFYLFKNNSL